MRIFEIVKTLLGSETKEKPKQIIGCYSPNFVYYCKLDSGDFCGLQCASEHGEFIYSGKED